MAVSTSCNRRSISEYILSAPRKVFAGAWQSDTVSLQREGWQFYCEYEIHTMSYNLCMVFKGGKGQMLSFNNKIAAEAIYGGDLPAIYMGAMGEKIVLAGYAHRGRRMYPVDMEPMVKKKYLETVGVVGNEFIQDSFPLELILFKPGYASKPYAQDEADSRILVEEKSVEELLGIIQERYAASDQEYYEQELESESGLITDQRVIKRHLHLVSVK